MTNCPKCNSILQIKEHRVKNYSYLKSYWCLECGHSQQVYYSSISCPKCGGLMIYSKTIGSFSFEEIVPVCPTCYISKINKKYYYVIGGKLILL